MRSLPSSQGTLHSYPTGYFSRRTRAERMYVGEHLHDWTSLTSLAERTFCISTTSRERQHSSISMAPLKGRQYYSVACAEYALYLALKQKHDSNEP